MGAFFRQSFLIRSLHPFHEENTVLPIEAVELFARGGTARSRRSVGAGTSRSRQRILRGRGFSTDGLSLRTGRFLEESGSASTRMPLPIPFPLDLNIFR